MTELEIARHNAWIDPSLHVWGWEIAVYLFLGGVAAGVMVLSALLSRDAENSRAHRWLVLAAPLALSIGMLALLLDLRYKLHVFRFYTAFRLSSPMSWGAWILIAIYPATLLFGLARLSRVEADRLAASTLVRGLRLDGLLRRARGFACEHEAAVRTATLLLGIALGVYTGILLSNLGARTVWNSALLGPLFLASGVSGGAALMMLAPVNRDEHLVLRRWDIGAIVVEATLLGLYLLALASSVGRSGQDAAALFLGGGFTAPFWALVVVAGLGVPL
ncbi:MAG TPA: NrfD/PsrC family molybdoenzyme membrane anchor subunit, partial [Methylomirabilota bacterium]|nr:NrfD/PsrC family molybdoenzyme membrane anchor subunit [Methylomirabilota bacterium]